MAEMNMNKVVGDTFEDLSIAEMTMVQGSGDVEAESTIGVFLSITAVVSGGLGSYASSVQLVKTIKSKC